MSGYAVLRIISPRRLQHILDKDPVPRRRIVHQHMAHRADQPAVLQDRAAGHE